MNIKMDLKPRILTDALRFKGPNREMKAEIFHSQFVNVALLPLRLKSAKIRGFLSLMEGAWGAILIFP